MRSNSNISMLILAIVAFVPLLSVNGVLDDYVSKRAAAEIQQGINEVSEETHEAVHEAIQSLSDILTASPSFCTPTFLSLVHAQLQGNLFLKQVLVSNTRGTQYCDAYEAPFPFTILSSELPIPGRIETVSGVRVERSGQLFLKVTRQVDQNRSISAFVDFSHEINIEHLAPELRSAEFFRVSLYDGVELVSFGNPELLTSVDAGSDYVIANSVSGEVPIRFEIAVPFSAVRSTYAELYVLLTIVACIVGAVFLFLALNLVRNSKAPSFDLETAILRGEIQPYYQPVIDLSTGQVSGCEMLARWIKPNGDVISPGAFIEYAEATGLALPMTIHLMQQVSDDLSELSKRHPDLKISINLFSGHFRDSNIVEDVQAIFGGTPISFRQLVFEITERHPLEDDENAFSVINGLRSIGVRLALDDVGTGHSNLVYVQKLGVDIIKIDKVFVETIDSEDASLPVLEGLISMALNMGSDIIAEGVETEAQARYLRDHGVKSVQGFLFSPALKKDKYLEMVDALNGTPESASDKLRGNTGQQAA